MKSTITNFLFITMIATFSFSQDYFNIEIDPTGVSQLIIFQNSITGLQDGDEIGVFDANAILESGGCSSPTGELLVGVDVWSGDQIALSSIGSIDNCAFGGTQQSGFVNGNSVIVPFLKSAIGNFSFAMFSAFSFRSIP